jgi:hypothetical protein
MNRWLRVFGSALVGSQLLLSHPASAVAHRGSRILTMDTGPTQDGSDDPIALAQSAFGIQAVHLMLKWTDIEVSPGVYDPHWLDAINREYPARNLMVHLSINPIDARNKHVPSDLEPLGFDNPYVIYRFCAMLNFAFSRMPDVRFAGFGIGNEVDPYFLVSPSELGSYKVLYDYARLHVRRYWRPELTIGVSANFSQTVGELRQQMLVLNQHSDAIFTLYYPVTGDPAAVPAHMAWLTALYPARRIHIKETGYPSSVLTGSSESTQADFIGAMFTAWDHHADQVELVGFFQLTDFAPALVDYYVDYYGYEVPIFRAFLGSLGLRTWPAAGTRKLSWDRLASEARSRGW